eukprot:TRINITY_DN1617_c0_g2_i4.p1 TRINITY_DN1617_c0_g2~~TRINITY_DN1617_c0_g2_i4.p1  ORF type:complete len:190 (+),score=6.93 TRINITY_DN1617_c0_g2_i4:22-570(+)
MIKRGIQNIVQLQQPLSQRWISSLTQANITSQPLFLFGFKPPINYECPTNEIKFPFQQIYDCPNNQPINYAIIEQGNNVEMEMPSAITDLTVEEGIQGEELLCLVKGLVKGKRRPHVNFYRQIAHKHKRKAYAGRNKFDREKYIFPDYIRLRHVTFQEDGVDPMQFIKHNNWVPKEYRQADA